MFMKTIGSCLIPASLFLWRNWWG